MKNLLIGVMAVLSVALAFVLLPAAPITNNTFERSSVGKSGTTATPKSTYAESTADITARDTDATRPSDEELLSGTVHWEETLPSGSTVKWLTEADQITKENPDLYEEGSEAWHWAVLTTQLRAGEIKTYEEFSALMAPHRRTPAEKMYDTMGVPLAEFDGVLPVGLEDNELFASMSDIRINCSAPLSESASCAMVGRTKGGEVRNYVFTCDNDGICKTLSHN